MTLATSFQTEYIYIGRMRKDKKPEKTTNLDYAQPIYYIYLYTVCLIYLYIFII